MLLEVMAAKKHEFAVDGPLTVLCRPFASGEQTQQALEAPLSRLMVVYGQML
jgi:hypothetical protein